MNSNFSIHSCGGLETWKYILMHLQVINYTRMWVIGLQKSPWTVFMNDNNFQLQDPNFNTRILSEKRQSFQPGQSTFGWNETRILSLILAWSLAWDKYVKLWQYIGQYLEYVVESLQSYIWPSWTTNRNSCHAYNILRYFATS